MLAHAAEAENILRATVVGCAQHEMLTVRCRHPYFAKVPTGGLTNQAEGQGQRGIEALSIGDDPRQRQQQMAFPFGPPT